MDGVGDTCVRGIRRGQGCRKPFGWGAVLVCEEFAKDKLDVALKILRTLQAVGRGCFGEYWDVPTAKRRYYYGTVREMRRKMGAAETALKELVGMSVLRGDVAGGGEGAGIREDGRVPGVHGEGLWE